MHCSGIEAQLSFHWRTDGAVAVKDAKQALRRVPLEAHRGQARVLVGLALQEPALAPGVRRGRSAAVHAAGVALRPQENPHKTAGKAEAWSQTRPSAQ